MFITICVILTCTHAEYGTLVSPTECKPFPVNVRSVTKALLCLLCRPEGVSSGSTALTVELLMFVLPLFAALMWEGNSDPLFVCQSICEDQSGWIMRHITSLPTSSSYHMTTMAK